MKRSRCSESPQGLDATREGGTRPRTSSWCWLLTVLLGLGSPLSAIPCQVPSTHATLGAAIADLTCTEITLSPQTFVEGSLQIARDLTIQGSSSSGTTIQGRLDVRGSGTQVSLVGLTLDASSPSVAACVGEALRVDGAQVVTVDVIARASASTSPAGAYCHLFSDGFETGGLAAWSSSSL